MLTSRETECFNACNTCVLDCYSCASTGLLEDNQKPVARAIKLSMECADICRLAAASIAIRSENMYAICRLCAEVCKKCEMECISHQMECCIKCAGSCRSCAEACIKLL